MAEEFENLKALLPHIEREILYEIYIYYDKDVNKILDTFLYEVKEEQQCVQHSDCLQIKETYTEDIQIADDALIARLVSEADTDVEEKNEDEIIDQFDQFLIDEITCESVAEHEETETINFVLSCIPENIDLDYVHERCTEIGDNTLLLQQFIDELTEGDTSHYEDYLQRNEAIAKQRIHLNKIRLTNFMEKFPSPVEYFTKIKESSEDEKLHSLGYLQTRYRLVDDEDLENVFESNKYNLTLTCQELDLWSIPTRDWRPNSECLILPDINMDFIYEIYFIENKKKILEYIELESYKQVVYDRAKIKEPKLECIICCEDELQVEDMAGCEDAHIFCKRCIKRQAEIRIGEGLTTFPCLDDTCKSEFSMVTLQSLLHPTLYKRTEQRRCVNNVRLAQIEDLESCPFCDYLVIIPPEINVFVCGNPECMKKSCRLCKEPDHTPLRCEEVEKEGETKMRTEIEDKMTEALVRRCNNCNKVFIKTSGCNKMVCQCGGIMCYICRKTIKDYSHFNGPEGSDYTKCPLFTNDEEMNNKDVKEAGKKAKAKVLSKNTGLRLKHDPTKL